METILQRLLGIDGVTGALLVGKDGLVVASTLEGEDEEFLAAISPQAVVQAQFRPKSSGDLLKRLVSERMTECVIHIFEMVNVRQDDADRLTASPGSV